MYNTVGKEGVESYLNNNQFAYRTGCSCTNTLLKVQNELLQALDSNDNRAVRLLTMDFSKASDRVKHNLLIEKLTQIPLNPYIACRLVRQVLVGQKTKSGLDCEQSLFGSKICKREYLSSEVERVARA